MITYVSGTAKFWGKVAKSLDKHSKGQPSGCTEWCGWKDRDGYGMKRVTWPDGSRVRQLVPVHRLVYMMDKKLLPSQMPQLDDKGVSLDVSHRCHNRACVLAEHIVLERHSDNIGRRHCRRLGFCTEDHVKCIL